MSWVFGVLEPKGRLGVSNILSEVYASNRLSSITVVPKTYGFPYSLHSGKLTWLAMENGPGLKMYFPLKMGIFQPAMLVYQMVIAKLC